jgi:hypothetical protein
MKFTQYKKFTSIIALTLISSNAFSAVNIFTPTGGILSGTQSQALHWDMLSNNATLGTDYSIPSGYTGGFHLSGHGDLHFDTSGSSMPYSGMFSGVTLGVGDVVGPTGLNWAASGFVINATSSTPIYHGLKFLIGSTTHYGWVKFTDNVTAGTQSVLQWAYESVAGTAITISESSTPSITSVDTQSSMQYQSRQLRSAFNTQTVAANLALNYDCNVFDVKGLCISAGGRYTTIDNPNINN